MSVVMDKSSFFFEEVLYFYYKLKTCFYNLLFHQDQINNITTLMIKSVSIYYMQIELKTIEKEENIQNSSLFLNFNGLDC